MIAAISFQRKIILTLLGDGELTEANGNSYKGSFYQHKKHGRGYQLYRLVL
jgi:hypothetical protein